ncbi:LysR family transcriptional regulator [Phreatobacter stygius]|uniref:LysR family transcriptional regulator n=1 Tax=Phreatobacter stygius TaxID=1940610 RepID=A0A4D7B815_9HYPH|nr:LysR family transcriptional regulator [Phreatobacter stygius]QCI67115.1 LysR family transcriptional regulator [Phreatobacter stygius]
MNLRSVDLNLLVVLDALLDEAHVSRAADRLGLSQPAASSALERCRHLFRDPLLERGKGMMRLTPKAETLRVPLKNLLAEATIILAPPAIDLADLSQTVRIGMADHPATVIAGPLHHRLGLTAPGIDVVIQPWHGASAALDALAKGQIDLAASVFPEVGLSFRRKHLLDEHYLVLMRKGHPAADGFDLERWLAFPHVLVSGRGETRGALDDALAGIGRTRRVGMVVPSFIMVPPLLAGSDLIALLPSRCLPPRWQEQFAAFEPAVAVKGFPLHLAWHVRRDQDMAVQHVAKIIQDLLR